MLLLKGQSTAYVCVYVSVHGRTVQYSSLAHVCSRRWFSTCRPGGTEGAFVCFSGLHWMFPFCEKVWCVYTGRRFFNKTMYDKWMPITRSPTIRHKFFFFPFWRHKNLGTEHVHFSCGFLLGHLVRLKALQLSTGQILLSSFVSQPWSVLLLFSHRNPSAKPLLPTPARVFIYLLF